MPKVYMPPFLDAVAVPGFPMSNSEGRLYVLHGGEPRKAQKR
jgi:hypothetical protein